GTAESLLAAPDPRAALNVPGLDRLRFPEQPQVAEAVQAVRYRVYPETPVAELVDLMIRRSLHAVPVVGEGYEVLGIVTTGDALEHLLARARTGGEEEGTARDIMTRAVLCVSEEQELREVAQLMVNRDVEQLPVVREGQLVGFITRDSVLEALFGGAPAAD
ncbi:MAG TPA: CBS domain-containing protein, partial [Longimicrobiales bacterium]|nr:CBS domain-containing protein [Longimicrobiales bacterium]